MAPAARRIAAAAATGIAGAALIAVRVWLLVLWSLPEVIGRPHPLAPGMLASRGSVLFDAVLNSAPVALPLAILAWLRGPWPLVLLSALMVAAGWHQAAVCIADVHAFDCGTTWKTGEAFGDLLARDGATPLFCAIATGLHLALILTQVRRAARP